MIANCILVLCLLGGSVAAETFTNRLKDGTTIVSTVTLPASRSKRLIPVPPMPPGMSAKLPMPTARKANPALAGVASVASQPAISLATLLSKRSSNFIVLVGRPIPEVKRVRLKRLDGASTQAGPPLFIYSAVNQPVIFPEGVVMCHVTNVKAVQMAGYDCRIEYTGDFMGWAETGDFGESPVDRTVEINWIIPMTEDLPNVLWRSVNYHR